MNSLQLQTWWHSVVLLLTTFSLVSLAVQDESSIKSAVFLSPKFVMTPGTVVNRFYHNIEFPRGHIGIKSFNTEVVDSSGIPVPLQQTYLHHWRALRYYQRKGVVDIQGNASSDQQDHSSADSIIVRNSGFCRSLLGQYFGLGSETRKTLTDVPDTYAIEVGNPAEIPDGFEERWKLNVHAIDTRGVVDKLGCTECRCNLYNVTTDGFGRPLAPDYVGGLDCCQDQTKCRLKPGFEKTASSRRELYMRYTVKWIDWSTKLVPVKIYLFDVTDTEKYDCQVEYKVERCHSSSGTAHGVCVHTQKASLVLPRGGNVVYGVAHQHAGGIGSTLYGADGRVICSSFPTYGKGKEAGNEAGYIVGMSTCYPQPGSVKISNGERLVLVSNYSSTRQHTGVMGIFYILVADHQLPNPRNLVSSNYDPESLHQSMGFHSFASGTLVLLGALLLAVVSVVGYLQRRIQGEGRYQPITI